MSFLRTLPRFLLILASVLMVTPEASIARKGTIGRICSRILSKPLPAPKPFLEGTVRTDLLAQSNSSELQYGTQQFFIYSLESTMSYLQKVVNAPNNTLEKSQLRKISQQINEINRVISSLLNSTDALDQEIGVTKLSLLWQLMYDFQSLQLFDAGWLSGDKYAVIFSDKAIATLSLLIDGTYESKYEQDRIVVPDNQWPLFSGKQVLVHTEMSGLDIGELLLNGISPINLPLKSAFAHGSQMSPDRFAAHDLSHIRFMGRDLKNMGFSFESWHQFLDLVNSKIPFSDTRRPILQGVMNMVWESHISGVWISPMTVEATYNSFSFYLKRMNEEDQLGLEFTDEKLSEVTRVIVDAINSLSLTANSFGFGR